MNLKIVSGGTAQSTKVYVDDKRLTGVKCLTWSVDVQSGIARAILQVDGVRMEFDSDVEKKEVA